MIDKISIALATYNGEKYLKEQLESIYSQSLLPDEIIAVDDCSTDGTLDILEEYSQKHNLLYYINKTNIGINRNFERAISLCSGDYIALCDQDDVWMPDKVEISYNKLKSIEDNKPALVSSGSIIVDTDLNPLFKPTETEDSDSYITTLFGHHSQGCSLMMNRQLVDYILPIPSDNKIVFDIYIGLTAAMIGNKYNIAKPLMYYRSHLSNACGRISPEKIPLKLRIKYKYINRFPKLVSEGRLYNMKIVADRQSKHFVSQRSILYNKLASLGNNNNIFRQLLIIWSINEISYRKRVGIIANTLMVYIIRKIFNIRLTDID